MKKYSGKADTGMVVDIHVHCYPDEVAERSVTARSKKFRIVPATDGTVGGLKKSMAAAGVDVSVMQPIAMKPGQTVKMNRWSLAAMDSSVLSFGTIHPDFPEWRQEIKWLSENGFKGVKFHADCQGYTADDPKMLRLYEAVAGEGLIILLHSGEDRAFTHPFLCTPKRIAVILDTFPGAKVIAAHMGGYRHWDETENYLLGRDIYLDTAYSLHELGNERLKRIISQHGADKILLGTDSPWRDPALDIAIIKALDTDAEDINGILGNNAARLLGLKRG